MWIYGWEPIMTSNTLSNLVAIGVVIVEISFLWLRGQDSTCSHFNPRLLFISKANGMKAHGMLYSVLAIRAKSKIKWIKEKKLSVSPKTPTRKKRKRMIIAKFFALQVNAIIQACLHKNHAYLSILFISKSSAPILQIELKASSKPLI